MTPLEKQNRELRGEIARLTDALDDAKFQIRELKRDLHLSVQIDMMAELQGAFPGLTAGEAWLMAVLYLARGKTVTQKALLDDMPGDPSEREPKILTVRASRLRRFLGRESIKNSFRIGYALTADGIAAVDAGLGAKRAVA